MRSILKAGAFAVALAVTAGGCANSSSNRPVPLSVNVFPGAGNIALFIAEDRGLFARHGLTVTLINTPNSIEQRRGLASGAFDIAQSAVDNDVAMVETAHVDVVIVSGGDGSLNEFMARPEVHTLQDIAGKNLVVDAPDTAFALVARKILKTNGLMQGRDYQLNAAGGTPLRIDAMLATPANAMAMLNAPWCFIAEDRGLHSLGRQSDFFGAYQSNGTFVLRSWARAHASVLESFLAAEIEATRIIMAPANHALVVATLESHLKLAPALAERTYQALLAPGSGLTPDARFDMEGFRKLLQLRSEMEGGSSEAAANATKYVDLSYYDRALQRAGAP